MKRKRRNPGSEPAYQTPPDVAEAGTAGKASEKPMPKGFEISPPRPAPSPESTSDTPDFQSGNF